MELSRVGLQKIFSRLMNVPNWGRPRFYEQTNKKGVVAMEL